MRMSNAEPSSHVQLSAVHEVPAFVRVFSPFVRRLLQLGIPVGPAALLTVRGRRTGVPRTTPVALIEVNGKLWVLGAYGEVNWVRNLRAAGDAVLRLRGRQRRIRAVQPALA